MAAVSAHFDKVSNGIVLGSEAVGKLGDTGVNWGAGGVNCKLFIVVILDKNFGGTSSCTENAK